MSNSPDWCQFQAHKRTVIRGRAVLAAMGLKQEAFYILVWAMVAIGVVIMFDRTGRLALLIFAFGAVAALAAGLTWAILVVFG